MITKLYTVFLGLLVALFIGVGISAFYPAPKPPEYPTITTPAKTGEPEKVDESKQREYEKQTKNYQKVSENYNRDVSLLALGGSIVLLALGLVLFKKVDILGDGLTLGSVFALVYSIIRGFASGDSVFRFSVVTVGLAVALLLGYLKFIKPAQDAVASKPRKKK